MMIRELWHFSPEKTAIKPVDSGILDPDKILIKSSCSLISSGTERIVCKGHVPPVMWDSMQVPHMGGSFGFPIKYGYSLVGIVIDGDERWIGKQVHVMHPHQDYALVSIDEVYEIPADVPLQRAVLASVLDTVVNAVWDSCISVGDNVLINGFGLIGTMLASVISRIPGVQMCICDENPIRKQLAETQGYSAVENGNNQLFDIVYNTTASGAGLQYCIEKAAYEGVIVELSWYGDGKTELNLGTQFHIRRQRIIASQVSTIPGFKQNRWDMTRRKDLVFRLLKTDLFDSLKITNVPFEDAPAVFDILRRDIPAELCYILTYYEK